MRRPSRQGLLSYCQSLAGIEYFSKRSFRNGALICLVLLSGARFGFAQYHADNREADRVATRNPVAISCEDERKDYLITRDCDSISIAMHLPSLSAMRNGDTIWIQNQIAIKDHDSLMVLLPKDLTGFCYQGMPYEAIRLSTRVQGKSEEKFCRRLAQGPTSVFVYYEVPDPDTGLEITAHYYFRDDAKSNALKITSSRNPNRADRLERLRCHKLGKEEILALLSEFDLLNNPKTSH